MTPNDLILTRRGVRFQNRYFPCTIGKTDITQTKSEGDGATPTGIHKITGMLYRPDRMTCPQPWAFPILPGDLWSDDPAQPDYNQPVRAPISHSHERMRRADPLYDLVLLTDWNAPTKMAPATPHRGSAIFLHQYRRPGYPTEGCVAFSRPHLHWIAHHLTQRARLIVRP